MEKSLDELNIINKSLINEKDELRKKLFEKIIYCEYFEKLEHAENDFFERVSDIFKDEEYEKLRISHRRLCYLINSIDYFIKEY